MHNRALPLHSAGAKQTHLVGAGGGRGRAAGGSPPKVHVFSMTRVRMCSGDLGSTMLSQAATLAGSRVSDRPTAAAAAGNEGEEGEEGWGRGVAVHRDREVLPRSGRGKQVVRRYVCPALPHPNSRFSIEQAAP